MLNADDPRIFAMRGVIQAQPWVFCRDPDSPAIREALDDGGRATTVIDGWIVACWTRRATRTRWSSWSTYR